MRSEGKITIFGDYLEHECIEQMRKVAEDDRVFSAVLCADAHLGYSVPVGGVLAYRGGINVNGVGYDIGCGNKAVRLDVSGSQVIGSIKAIMDQIQQDISFGVGRKNKEKVDHELFDSPEWGILPLLASLKDKAISQLGTVGSGNHYVDLFVDERDSVWVGVHFGSRGLGHTICSEFVKAGGGKDGVNAAPVIFEVDSDLGEQYLTCMNLAGRYAYAGRDWVCSKVAQILGANIVEEVHNHHNFAWKETHLNEKWETEDFWVIRKGATPAFPGQKGFIGSSMFENSLIVEGAGAENWPDAALYSTVHGAGRMIGRRAAIGKVKKGKVLKPGLVSKDEHEALRRISGVELRGGGLDESPLCYKRLDRVIKSHGNTINVLHTLRPIGVCMASDEYDPYKD